MMNQDMDDHTTSSSRTPAHRVVYTTSSTPLIYTEYALTPKEKERVDSADAPLNQHRCLIENYPNDHSVEYCHMIARKHAQNEDLMASLEWNWNMPYGTLNLNTRYNIFFAGAALHLHHDNGSWALLPDKTIIDRYWYFETSPAERGKFPEIQMPEDGFEYKLIPLGDSMKSYRILRQNEHALPPNKDQYTLHFYPFDTLPPFRSHLHPKFAIFELGRKFFELSIKDSAAAVAAVSSYPILYHVYRIYLEWSHSLKGVPLVEEWKNQGDRDGDKDRQSESSSKTGLDPWRVGVKCRRRVEQASDGDSQSDSSSNTGIDPWRMGVKRRWTAEQGSPEKKDVMQTENSSCHKRFRKSHSCVSLSHEGLIEHERVYGKGGWTQERLSGWAAEAS